MQLVFAIDDCACGFVINFTSRARKRGTRESHVVHSQALEIIVFIEFDVVRLQHFTVGAQVNALVIDDHTVEIEEDRVNHTLVCWPAAVVLTSSKRSFCSANSNGRRSLSKTSSRRSTSANASSFFRFT